MRKIIVILQILMLSLFIFPQQELRAQEKPSGDSGFNIRNFIFGHLVNDYEFHITDIKDHPITIPLPVIVKSENRGWFVFMSSKFHHRTLAYEGFEIATEGDNAGYIVEKLPDGSYVRPLDISITKNVFSILLASFFLCVIFLSIKRRYTRDPLKAPSGFQALLEPLILFVTEDVARPAIGEESKKYEPYLLTIFFFILVLNLMGLIPVFPFGANVTGNINVTAALTCFTFIITMVSTTKAYWVHKLWTPGVPVLLKAPVPLMPFVEVLGIFTGPMALVVRLFANMLAGHMVVIVLMAMIFLFSSFGALAGAGVSVISLLFSIFMILMDVLISFIQAYVFTLLSALYFGAARVKEH